MIGGTGQRGDTDLVDDDRIVARVVRIVDQGAAARADHLLIGVHRQVGHVEIDRQRVNTLTEIEVGLLEAGEVHRVDRAEARELGIAGVGADPSWSMAAGIGALSLVASKVIVLSLSVEAVPSNTSGAEDDSTRAFAAPEPVLIVMGPFPAKVLCTSS